MRRISTNSAIFSGSTFSRVILMDNKYYLNMNSIITCLIGVYVHCPAHSFLFSASKIFNDLAKYVFEKRAVDVTIRWIVISGSAKDSNISVSTTPINNRTRIVGGQCHHKITIYGKWKWIVSLYPYMANS